MDFSQGWNNNINNNTWNNNNNNNNNNNDDDLDAAIRASLAQYQQDETNRNKRQESIQTEDEQLAMALKLSQQMYQSQQNVNDNNNSNNNNNDEKDIDIDIDDDDNKEKNEKPPENDYQFSDDDDGGFDENGDYQNNEENEENEEFEDEEFEDEEFEDDDNDEAFDDDNKDNNNNDDDNDNDGWGNDDELIYDDIQRIEHKEYDEEDGQELMKRLKEKRRREQAKIENFWKCGKCSFLNHPSRPICMMCNMPELDVVHHILQCPKDQLKVCIKCNAYVIPHLYDDHVLDCKPLGGIDTAKNNQAWYVKLTPCEQNAINHVNALSIKKSNDNNVVTQLLKKIGEIDNGLYSGQCADVLQRLYDFMCWTVPIIIRIRGTTLIPILLKDTHYRSLFEINPMYKNGQNYNRNDQRVIAEEKMFGPVYNKATVFERPKYGCLNVGLRPEGCLKALGYGDCYFLMNDATVRWRTTLTIQDSFAVNGNCGTVKHCNHLLIQLNNNELKELIEAALFAKKGGIQQSTYREIQIHGPVQLNRDIISLHVPNTPQHRKMKKCINNFARKICVNWYILIQKEIINFLNMDINTYKFN